MNEDNETNEDMIPKLRVWPGDFGLPSIDPHSIQAMLLFKIHNVEINIREVNTPQWLEIPSVESGNLMVPRGYHFYKFIYIKCSPCNDQRLSFCYLMNLYSFKKYFADVIVTTFYVEWFENQNYSRLIRPWFKKIMLFPFGAKYIDTKRIVLQQYINNFFRINNFQNLEHLYECTEECLDNLNDILSDGRQYFSAIPTSFDTLVYSYITVAMKLPLPNTRLKGLIYERRYIVEFANRMTNIYFPNIPNESYYLQVETIPQRMFRTMARPVIGFLLRFFGPMVLHLMFFYVTAHLYTYIQVIPENIFQIFIQPILLLLE